MDDPLAESTVTRLHRDHIADVLSRAGTYAAHACDYAVLGDDRALARAVRMLCTYASHAAERLPDLAGVVERDKALRDMARAAYPPKPDLVAMAAADREAPAQDDA